MELSSTAQALLGLLSVRPWTTYELAHQTKRSLRFFFPRAERHLYAEAKRLAEAGLATSEDVFTGKRRGTRYAITANGRKELRRALTTPPSPPMLEAEVLLRAFFADAGRRDDLLAALDAAHADAVEAQRELAALAQSWIDGEAPFPERLGPSALTMRFVADFQRLVADWSTWAAAEVRTWDDARGTAWDGAWPVMEDVAASAS